MAGQDSDASNLGPHEYNCKKAQGVVVVLPKKQVVDRARRAGRGHQAVVERLGRRPNTTLSRTVTLPAGDRDADVQGRLEHRGLRAGPV